MTENELLEALRAAMLETDQGAFTTVELGEQLGLSDSAVRRKLKPLIRAGKIVPCRKVIRSMDGKQQPVSAYRVA